ncbi:MAG: nidogen-like domain-containing protein [Flavobacteriales bacterium]
MEISTLNAEFWRKKLKFSLVALPMLFFAVFNVSAQQFLPGTAEYQNAKESGLLNNEFIPLETEGPMPSIHSLLADAASRDNCIIPIDENTWTEIPSNDDSSTAQINLGWDFDLYGDVYSSVFVNNNGNITFNGAVSSFSASGFPFGTPMIAPFWGDVDTRGTGEVWYFNTGSALIVSYFEVGYYNSQSDKTNNFQVVITNGSDPLLDPGFNVAFYYGDMQWTTGSASQGVGGFGGIPATVGVNSGNNVDFIQIGRFDEPGNAYDGPGGEPDGVDWLDSQCFQFNVGDGGNIQPLVQEFDLSLEYCEGESASADYSFIGPEVNQTVTVSVEDNGNGGFAFDSNTAGNPSASTLSFSGLSEGTYTYQVIGTDDGDPVRSNILTVTVEVTDCGNNCDPVLAIVCPADASIECGDSTDPADLGMAVPSIDDCFDGDIQLSFTDAVSTVDDCTTMITRTWTATAGDMSEMCSQIIMYLTTLLQFLKCQLTLTTLSNGVLLTVTW